MDTKTKKEAQALLDLISGKQMLRPEVVEFLRITNDLDPRKANKEDRNLPNWKRGDE